MKLVILASLLLLPLFVKRNDAVGDGADCDPVQNTCTEANQTCVSEKCNKCRCITGFHVDPANSGTCIAGDARATVSSVTALMTSLFFVVMTKKVFCVTDVMKL